jgi:predicted transcriptional regulator
VGRDPGDRDSRRGRGDLEQEVLALVAASLEPVTVSQVAAALPGAPAYTTVMTTLSRLHAKGVLERRREGRAHVYALAIAPESVTATLTARRMRRLLDAEGDRADVLARFVAELTPEDEAMLARLVAEESPDQAPPERGAP